MYKFRDAILIIAAASILTGCADKTTKNEQADPKITQSVKEMGDIETPQDAVMMAASIFENASNLSEEQKDQLHDLYTGVYNESMSIRKEIGQYKVQLYTTLVKKDYKSSEINKLTKKIVALDKRRLMIMFKALKDAQKIIGQISDNENTYNEKISQSDRK